MELHALSTSETKVFTLASLPPDIIRIVILSATSKKGELKMISPVWNVMVREYQSDRRNLLPLKSVHLSSGEEQQSDLVVKVVQFHAQSANIFKGWTATADDITSPSLRLRIIEQDRLTVAAFLVYFVVALVVVAFRLHYFLSLAMLLVAVVCLVYIVTRVRPGVEQTRERLSWIFTRFASIESLHLHNVNRETLDVVGKLLGTVPIRNLIVYERTVDPGLRSRIVSMARVHKVDQITVCAMTFLETGLRQFCMAATETAKRLEIYESSGGSVMIFGYERQFWERKAKEMSDGSFSIRVMNGQQLERGDDTHKLRFRINA